MKKKACAALLLCASLANTPTRAADEAAVPAQRTSGVELQFIDPDIRVEDDFFRHLHGKWLATTDIPPDQPRWNTFDQLQKDSIPRLRGLIESIPPSASGRDDANAGKIRDLYASFMDQDTVERLGVAPLEGELGRIRALADRQAIPALVAHLDEIGVPTLYKVSVGQDERMATHYAVAIDQAELSMPDRDYYLEPQLAATKASYRRHVATMLGLAKLAHASALAGRVAAFETALARIEWTQLAARDRLKRYNRVAITTLPSLTPGYDLRAALAQAGIAGKADAVIVHEPSYLAGLAALISRTDLTTLRAYFEWRLLHAYAGYLSTPFVEDDFRLQAALNGTKENAPRWMRAVDAVQDALGDALGKLYAEKYFPAERKARVQAMVDTMLAAYRQSIDELDWMGPQTKKEAQAKLALITFKIGYPETWRDYAALVIHPDDLVGNMMRAASFEFRRKAAKLGKPVDRSEWLWPAQRIDADYRPTMNDITLFAGILQPPFFQDDADDAVNYGAIGAIIGHEISHAFDDKGSQSDGFGNLRDWWTPGDKRRFAAKTAMLVRQYDGYSPLPGYHVNGTLTLPENIADNSGLTIAFQAYHLSLAGKAAPLIDGLSGDQRFYIGFARVWRGKIRDARQIDLIKTDPHAPTEFRANGTLRNQAGFYDAFGVAPGDGMYLAPEQRVKIW